MLVVSSIFSVLVVNLTCVYYTNYSGLPDIYETEDSASTLMGNSDQSLNSEFYLSYQGHNPLPYHHDSGLYDDPHPSYPTSSCSNGSLHPPRQIPRDPPSYTWDTDFSRTEAHTSYPGLPSHTSPRSHTHNVSSQFTPDSSCGNCLCTTSYPLHTSEESGFDNEPTEFEVCPYAISHSSEESESEGVCVCVCVWVDGWVERVECLLYVVWCHYN